MIYKAVVNPFMYISRYPWLIIDEDYNVISRHIDEESAKQKEKQLNGKVQSDLVNVSEKPQQL